MHTRMDDFKAQPFHLLKEKSIFFIDRDGTLIIGERPLPGAREFINQLRRRMRSFYLLTNNSSCTPESHYEVLKGMGLNIDRENILVSIEAALSFFKARGIKHLYWVANKEVSQFIKDEGFVFTEENPAALLLTYDTEITYHKFVQSCNLIREGYPYYATHPDPIYITEEGGIPDIGTFIKTIEMTIGILPQEIFGKPYPSLYRPILKKSGLNESDAVIIGDRLDTDIKMAQGTKLTSVLVLSGVTKFRDYEKSSIRPHFIIESIGELIEYI